MVIILKTFQKFTLKSYLKPMFFVVIPENRSKLNLFFIISVVNLPETCTLNQIFSKFLNIVTIFLVVVICLKDISTLYNLFSTTFCEFFLVILFT